MKKIVSEYRAEDKGLKVTLIGVAKEHERELGLIEMPVVVSVNYLGEFSTRLLSSFEAVNEFLNECQPFSGIFHRLDFEQTK